jgi:acyl carrier protein
VLAHCRERLGPYKVPRLVEFRDALPRSPMGKILKAELGDIGDFLAGASHADFERAWRGVADEGRARQLELLAAQIQEQAARALQREPASVERSALFRDMGFDSLRAAELHLRLVRLTDLPLSISVLWNYPSIDDLAAALWAQLAGQPIDAPAAEATPAARASKDYSELLADVAGLSDAEVDAALRAK